MIYATQKLVKGVHGVVGEPVQGLQARLDPDLRRELSVGEFVY